MRGRKPKGTAPFNSLKKRRVFLVFVVVAPSRVCRIDPRLMRRSPDVLAISSRMEKPAGRWAACSALSIAPAVGLVLDFADLRNAGMRAVAVGILFQAMIIGATFTIGGRSLVSAIDDSLQQHQQQRRETATALTAATATTAATGGGTEGGDGGANKGEQGDEGGYGADGDCDGGLVSDAGDQPLVAARKKVKRMMVFALQNVAMVMTLLLVTVFTGYGVAAPLPFFMVPSE